MNLPKEVEKAVQPLLEAFPIDKAMGQLVVKRGASTANLSLVQDIVKEPAIAKNPPLCAALWLYVDELDRSHVISQGIENSTGSFWHGIMHRREGDFSNSHYWFHRVGKHPAMTGTPDYDPHVFIDEVESLHAKQPGNLVDLQRKEWATLFSWCAAKGAK